MQPLNGLSAVERYITCIHEAAHAVIFALGGVYVYRVAVASEGAAEWSTASRKGYFMGDLWGVCETSGGPTLYLSWDEENRSFAADRRAFNAALSGHPTAIDYARHEVRAHVCGTLAGLVAEEIYNGSALNSWWEDQGDVSHDTTRAAGYARLLPWRNEYDHAAEITEGVLRRPDVWGLVVKLADELARTGNLEGDELERLLPAGLLRWPTSPRGKYQPFPGLKPV